MSKNPPVEASGKRLWFDSLPREFFQMYDPTIGKFISVEPIGFDAGDANLYRYVGNDPTGFTDPSGFNGWAAASAAGLIETHGFQHGSGWGPFGYASSLLKNEIGNTIESLSRERGIPTELLAFVWKGPHSFDVYGFRDVGFTYTARTGWDSIGFEEHCAQKFHPGPMEGLTGGAVGAIYNETFHLWFCRQYKPNQHNPEYRWLASCGKLVSEI